MKDGIRLILLKIAMLMVGASMAIFGLGSGIVIFARITEILAQMPYTKAETSAILVALGAVLIWLIALLANSSEWIVKESFKKIDNIYKQKGVN